MLHQPLLLSDAILLPTDGSPSIKEALSVEGRAKAENSVTHEVRRNRSAPPFVVKTLFDFGQSSKLTNITSRVEIVSTLTTDCFQRYVGACSAYGRLILFSLVPREGAG